MSKWSPLGGALELSAPPNGVKWSPLGGGLELSAPPNGVEEESKRSPLGGALELSAPPNGVEDDPNMSKVGLDGFNLGFSALQLSRALLVQLPLGASWNLIC